MIQPPSRCPLLLVVHGRGGGERPAELESLAHDLERLRGAPVRLQTLTAAQPPSPDGLLLPGLPLTLVPLLLLPGGHVRHDLPAIARHWSGFVPVQRWPFLGAWPRWQAALAVELETLVGQRSAAAPSRPLLLHHPLDGPLAARYLATLEESTAARCVATPYSAEHLARLQLSLSEPALPLALAANRLTDQLAPQVGPPLLQRPALRAVLLDALEALP